MLTRRTLVIVAAVLCAVCACATADKAGQKQRADEEYSDLDRNVDKKK
jgi:hypothetical protein